MDVVVEREGWDDVAVRVALPCTQGDLKAAVCDEVELGEDNWDVYNACTGEPLDDGDAVVEDIQRVEARPSRSFAARRRLREMGYQAVTLTVLERAVEEGAAEAVQLLCATGDLAPWAHGTVLCASCCACEVREVALLAAHVDVNAADRWGDVPLVCAAGVASEGDAVSMCTALLEGGADPNQMNMSGWSAAMAAAATGAIEVCRVLAAHGADLTVRDSLYGRTPQAIAREEGHTSLADILGDLEVHTAHSG